MIMAAAAATINRQHQAGQNDPDRRDDPFAGAIEANRRSATVSGLTEPQMRPRQVPLVAGPDEPFEGFLPGVFKYERRGSAQEVTCLSIHVRPPAGWN